MVVVVHSPLLNYLCPALAISQALPMSSIPSIVDDRWLSLRLQQRTMISHLDVDNSSVFG